MFTLARITVTDSGLFLDGGSIRLTVVDPLTGSHQLLLDLSFVSRNRHYVPFYLNGVIVLKNSFEESQWLALLEHTDTIRVLQDITLSALQLTRCLGSIFCDTIRSANYDLPPGLALVDLSTLK